MKKSTITSSTAISAYFFGFIITNHGFSKMIVMESSLFIEAIAFIMLGMLFIFLSSKMRSLMTLLAQLAHLARPNISIRKWSTVTLFIVLFLGVSAHAQESQSGIQLKNVEFGSRQIFSSDSEHLRSYFGVINFQVAHLDDIKLWLYRHNASDQFGENKSLPSFLLETSPSSWLSLRGGYTLMPVGSFQVRKSLGRFSVGFGGGREAIISRSTAIADRIDHKSAYVDFSLNLTEAVSLGLSAGRGKYGDSNNLKTFNSSISFSKEFGKLHLKSTAGYSARKLDQFSVYYWSPGIYRELFIAPDIGLVFESFWLYINFSVDRILEERFSGSANAANSWGFNSEVSLGLDLGPGNIYLTGRYWNSGVQRFSSAYSGQIFEVSYKLSLNNH